MAKDYYKTLELDRNASEKDVKSAYRRLALKYHPDKNPGDKQAEERFKDLGEAYSVLSNSDKRRKYDQFGGDWEKYDRVGSNSSGTRSSSGFGYEYPKSSGNQQGFSDIFDSIFGTKGRAAGNSGRVNVSSSSSEYTNRRSTPPRPTRGEDREQEIELSLEEAFNGTTRHLQIQSSDPCQSCNGTGVKGGMRCTTCLGLGVVPRSKQIAVNIPAGVEEGNRVRVAGEGGSGLANGTRGDLNLKVHIVSHPVFERKGKDLYTTLPLALYTATLGGEAIVPSLKGPKLGLNVPAETQNGKVFRLTGQGMPVLNQPGARGDLYVRVEIILPSNLSDEEKTLFHKLRELRPGN